MAKTPFSRLLFLERVGGVLYFLNRFRFRDIFQELLVPQVFLKSRIAFSKAALIGSLGMAISRSRKDLGERGEVSLSMEKGESGIQLSRDIAGIENTSNPTFTRGEAILIGLDMPG